jgi:hypothetical protein
MQPSSYSRSPAGASPWTTRVDPMFSRPYGVEEVHSVWFMPEDWHPGMGAKTVTLLIPECELQLVEVMPDGEPICIINRPRNDHRIKRWVRDACALAAERNGCLSLGCDTAEQAEHAARRASKWLPKNYSHVALERMYDPESRIKEKLS